MSPEDEFDEYMHEHDISSAISEAQQQILMEQLLSELFDEADIVNAENELASSERLTSLQAPPEPPKLPVGRVVSTNNTGLDKATEKQLRLNQVLSKFATTLALKPITVEAERLGTNASANSDGQKIVLNKDRFDINKDEDIVVVKGLGLHETAHIMFSPRSKTKLSKAVENARSKRVWKAYNALEDQRIESIMNEMFSDVGVWLTANVAKFLLNSPEQVPVAYPMLYGRKYLPAELRNQLKSVYSAPDITGEIESLIDEYISLNVNDSANASRAMEIIERFAEIVDEAFMDDEQMDNQNGLSPSGWDYTLNPNGDNGHENPYNTGRPVSPNQMQDLTERLKNTIQQQAQEPNSADDQQPQPSPSGVPTQGQQQGQGDANGDDKSDDGKQFGKAGGAPAVGKVTEMLKNTLDNIVASKSKEIHKMKAQINGLLELDGKTVKPPERSPYLSEMAISDKSAIASKSFARELEELRAQYEPAWDRKVDQGRLNVQRYVTGGELDEAFDQWDTGREDAVDIECVILLDNSGSMMHVANQAYEAMWAVKRALDKVNASTTVVTFSDDARMLYTSNERASATVFKTNQVEGGTDPSKAVNYAYSVLANSKRAIKILIPITDGYWYGAKDTDDSIRRLRAAGVITALGMIGDQELKPGETRKIDTHGCEVGVDITDVGNLFQLARAMVRVGIERNLS